jgi:ketosteroid isomerase-like protein
MPLSMESGTMDQARDTAQAMSEENVEVVRRSFDAIARGELDALLELYDPKIEFQPLTGTRVESGGYRGHAGVRKYFAEAAEVWDEVRPVAGDVRTIGDEVVVFGHCAIRGKASRIATTSPTAWVVTVCDGMITRHRVYRTNDEALEAAGLSE